VRWAKEEIAACRALAGSDEGAAPEAVSEAMSEAARRLQRLGIFVREPDIWNNFLELLLDFRVPPRLRQAAKAGLDRWLAADASFSEKTRSNIVQAMQSLVAEDRSQWDDAAFLLIHLLGENADLTRAVILPMLLRTNNTALITKIILPHLQNVTGENPQLMDAAQALRAIAADKDVLPVVYELLLPHRPVEVRKAAVAALIELKINDLTVGEKAKLLKQMEELHNQSALADVVVDTVARWAFVAGG
jgi:hypothetical protein